MNLYKNGRYFKILIFITLFMYLSTNIAISEKLDISITDLNGKEINEILENKHFKVSVLDIDQPGTPYVLNVTIIFDELPYTIVDESAELTLQSPQVDSDRIYQIYALKEGYESSNKTIFVLNNVTKYLVIITDDVVDAGRIFSVYVKNENGDPVPNVLVGIENNWEERDETDSDGRAWLTAPDDQEEITILAQKDKYTQVKHKIRVNIEEHWLTTFLNSPTFPIIIALFILMVVIIYVNQRQKKSIFEKTSKIAEKKSINKKNIDNNTITPSNNKEEIIEYKSGPKDLVRSQTKSDSKIEEIRITRTKKKKEIVPVRTEIDKTEKIISKNKIKKQKYDWFEGTDDIRYEIDKLTGKIDLQGKDKWFEGIDNIREKIDEKLKNKDNKKENKN